MLVSELIRVLQRQKQDAEFSIIQSQYDWDEVLGIIEDPSNPDDIKEIRV